MGATVSPRAPQLRLPNRPELVDVRLPPGVKRRRLSAASVAAACEQLGEHVSTRNVRAMLGGSLRDIGPLVRAWRATRAQLPAPDTATDTPPVTDDRPHRSDQAQALGAILLHALRDHAAAIRDTVLEEQDRMLARVERLLDRRTQVAARELASRTATATPPATNDLADLRVALHGLRTDVRQLLARPVPTDRPELDARLQRLQAAIETAAPAPVDLAPVLSGLDQLQLRLDKQGAAHAALDGDLAHLHARLDHLITLQPHAPAPVTPDPRLDALAEQLVDVQGQLAAGVDRLVAHTAAAEHALATRLEVLVQASGPDPALATALGTLSAQVGQLPDRDTFAQLAEQHRESRAAAHVQHGTLTRLEARMKRQGARTGPAALAEILEPLAAGIGTLEGQLGSLLKRTATRPSPALIKRLDGLAATLATLSVPRRLPRHDPAVKATPGQKRKLSGKARQRKTR